MSDIPEYEESKSVVVKSRKWDNPNILAYVNNEEIGLAMKLDDFLNALVEEIGSPALIVTKEQLKNKVMQARKVVEMEMHDMSRAVV